jgi:hypothetical protein
VLIDCSFILYQYGFGILNAAEATETLALSAHRMRSAATQKRPHGGCSQFSERCLRWVAAAETDAEAQGVMLGKVEFSRLVTQGRACSWWIKPPTEGRSSKGLNYAFPGSPLLESRHPPVGNGLAQTHATRASPRDGKRDAEPAQRMVLYSVKRTRLGLEWSPFYHDCRLTIRSRVEEKDCSRGEASSLSVQLRQKYSLLDGYPFRARVFPDIIGFRPFPGGRCAVGTDVSLPEQRPPALESSTFVDSPAAPAFHY